MSTLTMTPTDAPNTSTKAPPDPARHPTWRLSNRGILRSEWVKLRSLRSNSYILAGSAGVMLIVGLIFSAMVGGVISNTEEAGQFAGNPTGAALTGILFAQLVIGVLGVLAITSEHATGMIRTSLTMVPKRLPVLAAKAAVVAGAAFATMIVSTFVVFFAGQALIAQGTIPAASLGDPGVLRAVVGTAGYLTGIALIGLAIGTLLRSTAGAISSLVGLVFLLPGLGGVVLSASWRVNVLQYLPSNAGDAFMQVKPSTDLLSPMMGAVVFVAWIVVPLATAAIAFRRRPT